MSGRTTLVTGASSGIGRELARFAAVDSSRIVLVARRRDRLEELAGELEGLHAGLEAIVWPCDLAKRAERGALLTGLVTRDLAIDHLIAAAGVGDAGAFVELGRARARRTITLDVVAWTELLAVLVPPMVERGYGRVLNVSSTAGFQPVPFFSAYAASKAFILALSEALWSELRGSGVTVTCLVPGRTDTEFFTVNRGFDRLPLFARLPAAAPRAVAELGYRAMMAGKRRAVPGLLHRLNDWAVRLAPRRWVLFSARLLFRPRRRAKESA